jgi:hypothetical protein
LFDIVPPLDSHNLIQLNPEMHQELPDHNSPSFREGMVACLRTQGITKAYDEDSSFGVLTQPCRSSLQCVSAAAGRLHTARGKEHTMFEERWFMEAAIARMRIHRISSGLRTARIFFRCVDLGAHGSSVRLRRALGSFIHRHSR